MKTNISKSILKRLKIKSKKIFRKKAFKSHLCIHKSKSRLRKLCRTTTVSTKLIFKLSTLI